MPELSIQHLHLWRGERHVLRDLGLVLPEGHALQLLWPNGAGKTSLLRALAGFLHVESGEVRWDGRGLRDDESTWTRDIAWLGHELALKGDLTPLENLEFAVGLRRTVDAAALAKALTAAGLHPAFHREATRHLSAGQQRRVALARLSLWNARLWLLDEPASNLDAAGQQFVADVVVAHLRAGGSALIATHQALALDGVPHRLSSSAADLA
jgi:heme exporter protein A